MESKSCSRELNSRWARPYAVKESEYKSNRICQHNFPWPQSQKYEKKTHLVTNFAEYIVPVPNQINTGNYYVGKIRFTRQCIMLMMFN
jgi:hypothetical protein